MDTDAFRGNSKLLLDAAILTSDDFFLDLCLGFDRVERPFLLGVLSSYLLHGSCEETLRIVETSQPEGNRPLSTGKPIVKLEVSIDQTLYPATEGWREPRDLGTGLELPFDWHTEVIDLVDCVDQVSSHDNCTFDGCYHVVHSFSNNAEHMLELFNLLTQEDAKWDVLCRVKTSRNLHGR